MTVKTNSGYNNYYFRKNIFGDILAVYNSSKTVLATYTYDAFGNASVTYANVQNNLARLNPFRYRGYYWDDDLELYYLQSRYYDPEIGRFISPDSIENINPSEIFGLNLYAYCNNNPIMNVDPTGKDWNSFWNSIGSWFEEHWVELVIGTAFIIVGAVVTALTAGTGAGFMAAFGSALLASAKATGISMAISAGIGALVGGITNGWEGALQGFGDGLADGFMWGGIFAGGAQILSGVFRIAAELGMPTGRKGGIFITKNIKIFSPNNVLFYENGGTLLKIGESFRIDVGTRRLLHMCVFNFKHFPLGTVLASIFGSLDSIW